MSLDGARLLCAMGAALGLAACGSAPMAATSRAPDVATTGEEDREAHPPGRLAGARIAELPSCMPSEPIALDVVGPLAVEPGPDRSTARLDAVFDERGAIIVWTGAHRDDGTWVVVLNAELAVRSIVRAGPRYVGPAVVLVPGGALVAGHRFPDDGARYVTEAFVVSWDGSVGPVVTVAEGNLVGLGGGEDAWAVTSRGADAALHRLRLGPDASIATEMVAPTLAVAPGLLGMGLHDGRLAASGDRWAMIASSEGVLTSDGLVTVPLRGDPLDVLDRRLAYVGDALIVEDLSLGQLITHAVVEGTVEPRGEVPLSDASLLAIRDAGLTIGPGAGTGTSIVVGPTRWEIPDDGSWAETWLGWNRGSLVMLYAGLDQSRLFLRGTRCP